MLLHYAYFPSITVKVTNNFQVDKPIGHLDLSLVYDIVGDLLLHTLCSLGFQNTTPWVFLLLTSASFSTLLRLLMLKIHSILFCSYLPSLQG